MTPLPQVICKAGFELMLIHRVGKVAIYRQHLPGANPDHDAYEVILPQVRNTNHKGQRVEPYEAYPSAESWGTKGWTFTNLDKAFQKLLQLRRRAAQKASCAGTVSRSNRGDGQGSLRGRLKARTSPLVPRQMFQPRVERTADVARHCKART
jgi:hypothetical protein